jgi:hypothetical protein
MKNTTKLWMDDKLYDVLRKVSHEDFKDTWLRNVSFYTIKFIDFIYRLITMLTLSITLIWFIPIYLKRGYEVSIIIALLLILIQLRWGKITTTYEE